MLRIDATERTLSPARTRATARSRKSIEYGLVIAAASNPGQQLESENYANGNPFRFTETSSRSSDLGYQVAWSGKDVAVTSPPGRRAIFLGDFVDRGPRSPDVLRIAKSMVEAGTAFAVVGNHDDELKRHLSGKQVKVANGLAETIAQLAEEPPEFLGQMRAWLDTLVSHYVLDGGKLVVAHAGL